MRKLKKFKRYAEGGALGAGGGDPFAYTEFEPGRGEKNLEGIKNFFGFGKKEPVATEDRDTSRKAPEPVKETKTEKAAEPAKTSPVKTPSVAQQMKDREKGGPNERANYASTGKTSKPEYDSYSYGPDNLADGNEGVDSFTSTGNSKKAEAYRQSLMSGNKPKPKPPAPAAEKTPAPAAEKTPPPAKAPRAARPEDIPGTDVKTPYKGETIDNSNLAAKQFGQSMLGASPALRGAGAAVRGTSMLGRTLESGSKPTPKTEPTLAPSTSAPSTPASSTTPRGGDPRAAANRRAAESETKEAPKEAPKAEPKAETKSGAIQPTGKGPSEAGKNLMEKGKGSLKDQAIEAVNKQRAADKDSRGPVSGAIKPTGEGPSAAGKALMERAGQGKPAPKEAPKPTPKRETIKERTQREINRQRELDNDRRGSTGLSPMGQRAQELIKKQREADKYSGDAGVDKVLAKHDLPRKKGGKIPAFKNGGLVGRGDGCAMRGKTKGRMV